MPPRSKRNFGVARFNLDDVGIYAKGRKIDALEKGAATKAEWGGDPVAWETIGGQLREKWVIPPFSVLDTRQGYWQEQRRKWLSLGIKSELGRGVTGAIPTGGLAGEKNAEMRASARAFNRDLMRGEVDGYGSESEVEAFGTSIFDPVLCEVAYKWWCPPGGSVLDPFAGGSVRGIVAAMTGHPYTGIDLSARQCKANEEQAHEIVPDDRPMPRWIVGDSYDELQKIEGESQDMIFTCPPYFDLEIYSDDPRDLSNLPSYGIFSERFREIIDFAARALKKGRYAAYVISEIRGPGGGYVGFVPDTIRALNFAGMTFYNEAILVNVAGSLPVRAGRQFTAGRKLGRMHQSVIVGGKIEGGVWHAPTVLGEEYNQFDVYEKVVVGVKGDPEKGIEPDQESVPEPQLGFW
jgi:hypothetical protein